MAHDRKRHIEEIFYKLLGFHPIVGIFGHRQVGKSTFIVKNVKEYRTLDDIDQLDSASESPKKYVSSVTKTPLAIDECQLEPKLFPTLKEWVRTSKKPGQFVLSGSVRFTSRKAIKESLAGRMAVLEMVPFSISSSMRESVNIISFAYLCGWDANKSYICNLISKITLCRCFINKISTIPLS